MDLAPITPETRPQTEQEVFDYVVRFLRKQGRRAVGGMHECLYRADDGAKCAAGCLIPDDDYSPKFEGDGLSERAESKMRDRYFQANYGFARGLILELQHIHDNEEDVSMWEHWWRKTATARDLTVPQ